MKNNFILFLFLIIGIVSCKPTKEASEATKLRRLSPKVLAGKIEKRTFNYQWFSSKIKIDYSDTKLDQAFTANLRMKRDSVIWISLTGFLGLEGGRVLITQDSVKIIDRLNKEYLEYPFSFLNKYFPMQASIADVQNILSGSGILDGRSIDKVEIDKYSYQAIILEQMFDMEFWIHPKNYTYTEMRLKNRFEDQQFIYKFDDYKPVNKQLLSHARKIEIENGNQQISIDMQYSKIETNKKVSFPFEVPSRYKKAG